MSTVCDNSLHDADVAEAAHRHDYNVRCQNTIASVIGFPNTRATKLALKQYQETGKASDKRKYELHKAKYVAHRVLYDLLEKDIMDAYDSVASSSANPEELANPTTLMKGWQQIFERVGHGAITPRTAQMGARKLKSLGGLVQRIQKKRDKLMAKGGNIPKYAIAIAPPQIVASWADRYGVLNPIIERVLRQSDTNVQQTSKYGVQFEEARQKANTIFGIIAKNELNMNNGSMSELFTDPETGELKRTGIKGVRLTASKTTGWTKNLLEIQKKGIGSKVIITGEATRNGIFGYMFVTEENQGDDPKWLPADSFDKTRDEMTDLLINKYKNELLYELGSGQVRYVVPKVISVNVDEKGLHDNKELAKDIQAIRQKLAQMQVAAKKAKETGVTTRVPGVHTKHHVDELGQSWEYRYVMIKQGEGDVNGERYNLYLIDKAETATVGGRRVEGGKKVNFIGATITMLGDNLVQADHKAYDANELFEVMGGEGFYRSDSYNDFGQYTNREGEPIYGTQKKQFTDFRRMGVQPNEAAMEPTWELLSSVRNIYSQVWAETSVMVSNIERDRQKWDAEVRKQLKKHGYKDDDIEEYFNQIYNMGGIENNLRRDEESGDLIMPHTYSRMKSENYMPSLYHTEDIQYNQIPLQIDRLKEKIAEFKSANPDGTDEKLNKTIERYEEGLEHLMSMSRQFAGLDEPDHNIFDLKRISALKHITAWTNPLRVRKDEYVMSDYLNNMYSAINRNRTTVEMLKALHHGNRIDKATVSGEGMLNGAMEYMVNRVKIAYGDTSSRAMTIFGNERSYDTFATNLNGLPPTLTGGVKWDGQAAERLTKWLTAPMTMIHLGGSSAVVNNTQFVNRFIRVGWHGTFKAQKLWNSDDLEGQMWKKIVKNTGVLNILSVFEDIMLKDGDVKWNDAGVVNFGMIPIPTRNLALFARLLWKGRDSFIEGGKDFQKTDEFLAILEHRARGKTRSDIQKLRDTNQLLKGLTEDDMKRKRGEYYDIWRLEEGASEKIIKRRFKQLLGDVADSELKKMVSWKLSWWFDELGGPGKGAFTFSKTEERMRAMTAISAILEGEKAGLLGTGNNEEIYFSDAAVKLARNAVYAEQFGMTPPHMGELFNGFGRYMWQYKQYPTNQMIHDYNVWKRFTDGNHDWIDGVERITRAIVHMSTKEGDTTHQEYDQEAIQMGRFLFTRAIASTLGTMASTVPYLNWAIRYGMGGTDIGAMIRGAENPAVATVMRAMLFVTLVGMGAGDDDDKEQALLPFQYLLVPVTIGTIIRWLAEAIDD